MNQHVKAARERSTGSTARVLHELRTHGAMTRRQLEQATGFSRPTVSRALAELLRTRTLVEVDDPIGPSGRGRPSRPLRLNPQIADGLGLEIARGHVAVAITDASGAVVATADKSANPSSGLTSRTRSAIRLARAVADQRKLNLDQLRRVVAGIPGPQPSTGLSPSQVRSVRAVRCLLSESFGAEVSLANNTRLTTMAAVTDLADRGAGNLIFIRIDEGIGGGFVLDGRLADGHGAAGEFGHVCVDPAGRPCECGGRGCLETVSSLPALLRATRLADPEQLTDRSGRAAVRKIIDTAAAATGQMLAGAVAVLNPGVVVLGGRVAALPGFAEAVEATVRRLGPQWAVSDLVVEVAGEDRPAGARGAATMASNVSMPTAEGVL